MPTYEIDILGENTVFVSGNYIRYNEDGEEISQSGSTYLYQNKPEGWRVISIINKREYNVRFTVDKHELQKTLCP